MAFLNGIAGANSISESSGNGGSIDKLPAGGYVCRIINVKVETPDGDKSPFIKFRIEIDEGEYRGYFKRAWDAQANSQYERRWKGISKVFIPSAKEQDKRNTQIGFYKNQINSICRSNSMAEPDYERGFDPDMFKGKIVGVLFREAEFYSKNNGLVTFTESAMFIEADRIRSGDFTTPKKREAEKPQAASNPFASQPQPSPSVSLGDFEEILSDGEVPF